MVGGLEQGNYFWTSAGLTLINKQTNGNVIPELATTGVTADGSTVAGYYPVAGGNELFLGTTAGIVPEVLLPNISNSVSPSVTTGISGDGTKVVGHIQTFNGSQYGVQAFVWTAAGVTPLPNLPGGVGGEADGISANGQVIVGRDGPASAPQGVPTRWIPSENFVDSLIDPTGNLSGGPALAASSDGSVIVGYSYPGGYVNKYSLPEAFIWNGVAKGLVGLGYLPGDSFSEANAVSSDGSIVVGESGSGAFIWDAQNGMRSIQSVLSNDASFNGGLAGWSLQNATAVTKTLTGIVVTGTGENPQGYSEGWVANLTTDQGDISLDSTSLVYSTINSSSTTSFNYHTVGNPGTFTIGLYQSPIPDFNASQDTLISSQEITQAGNSSGKGSFTLTFAPNPSKPYLLLVVNPDRYVAQSNGNVHALPVYLLSLSQLQAVMPLLPSADANNYITPLNEAMEQFQINTPKREAAFLAQIDSETNQLRDWVENKGTSKKYAPYYGRGPIMLTFKDNYSKAATYFGNPAILTDPSVVADKSNPIVGFDVAGWFWSVRRASRNLNAIADSLTDTNTGDPVFYQEVFAINFTISKAVNGINKKTRLPNGLNTRYTDYINALKVLLGNQG